MRLGRNSLRRALRCGPFPRAAPDERRRCPDNERTDGERAMALKLSGRTALVIGASAGIGAGIAEVRLHTGDAGDLSDRPDQAMSAAPRAEREAAHTRFTAAQ